MMRSKLMVGMLATLVATGNGFVLGQEPASPGPVAARQDQTAMRPDQSQEKSGAQEPDQKKPAVNPSDSRASHAQPGSEEEAGIAPYYNNFFETYRLGPEDVISVSVFGQERYSKSGIVIPPNGRISYPLIAEGVLVAGKTVEEIAATLTKRLDEYIIDPKITVSLDKAVSYRYSVIGDVAQPGIKIMARRLTVTEALAEAGGVLPTGNKKKVVVLRRNPGGGGSLDPIPVDVSAIYKRRAPDIVYLRPGDQVIVPGNRMKQIDKILSLLPVLSFARIFTGSGW